jgi:transglutaminase/protease-like cytokinesis protein 3
LLFNCHINLGGDNLKKGIVRMLAVSLVFMVMLSACTSKKAVQNLKLDKPNVSMEVGTEAKLNLVVEPADADNPEIEWQSSDVNVVTVDNSGQLKALSVGNATITARTKDQKHSVESSITVTPKSVTGIKLNKDAITLVEGSGEKLEAVIEPADAGNKKIIWESSNTKVASVGQDGSIKGVAPGTADITAKTEDGGLTAKCTVKVNAKPAANTSGSTPSGYPKVKYYEGIVSFIESSDQKGPRQVALMYANYSVQPEGIYFKVAQAGFSKQFSYKVVFHAVGGDITYKGVTSLDMRQETRRSISLMRAS